MILTVLGSGTFQPTMQRGCSGYLIDTGAENVLFDCGPGVLRQLAAADRKAGDIDHIFLSHMHPDHICDLVPILFAKKHAEKTDHRSLNLYGPPGFKSFLKDWMKPFMRWFEGFTDFCTLSEYRDMKYNMDSFSFLSLPVEHTENSYGLKIENESGITLAYSGDSDYCTNLVELCRDADTSILECSFNDNKKVKGHLSPADIKMIAQESGCRNFIISHIFPETDTHELINAFSGIVKTNFTIAKELCPISITRN